MNRPLRWLMILLGLVVAAGLFDYLIACGPGLVTAAARTPATTVAKTAPKAAAVPSTMEGGKRVLRLGWTAWADAEVISLMARRLLQDDLGQPTERVMTDIGIQYQAVANGDLDAMLMAWLPKTHADYWARVRDRVVDLGRLYTGRLGWAVPAYVPKDQLDSIADLARPEVARRIGGRIQGIDPGSGLMQASERAMPAYGLDHLQLVSASGAAMTAVLDRAIRQHRWVVVTAWQPHWIFARYQLRFLKDPKGLLGGVEHIDALAREGFSADFPEAVTGLLSRMYLPEDAMAALLLAAEEGTPEDAVAAWLHDHPRRVRYWLTGEIEE